jgi:hypothetical protein
VLKAASCIEVATWMMLTTTPTMKAISRMGAARIVAVSNAWRMS